MIGATLSAGHPDTNPILASPTRGARRARRRARSPPSPRWAPRAVRWGRRWGTGRSRARSRRWSGWRTPGGNPEGAGRRARFPGATGRWRRRASPPPPGPRRNSPGSSCASTRSRLCATRSRTPRRIPRGRPRRSGARRARVRLCDPSDRTATSRPRRPRRPREGTSTSPHLREEPTEKGIVPPSTTRVGGRPPRGARGERAGGCVRRRAGSRSPGVVAARPAGKFR